MSRGRALIVVVTLVVLAACAETPWTSPSNPGVPAAEQLRVAVECTADVVSRVVRCDPPARGARTAASGRVTMGGQGHYLLLASSNTSYNSGTQIFQTDVTLQNRSAQPLGTMDGIFPDGPRALGGGIRVFFTSGPTGVGGSVTVANPDSIMDITGPSQRAFIYEELLAGGATSGSKTWQFNVPTGVTSFTFQVQVSATVPQVAGVLRYRQDGARLNAVSCASTSFCFATGNFGTIRVWTGSTWTFMGSGTISDLLGVSVFSTAAAMAVGANGTALYWNGSYWRATAATGAAGTLRGVWCASGSDCFAVGDGATVLRWNGTAWNEVTVPFNGDLHAVWGATGSDVYVSGDDGLLFHWNGSNWEDTEISSTESLQGIWGSGPTDVFVVGTGGAIWRGSGTTFTSQTNPSPSDLYAVGGLGAGNVFAAGPAGKVLRFNGISWSNVSAAVGATQTLAAVAGTGSNVFLAGGGGTIVGSSNSGAGWTTSVSGTENTLNAVWGTSAGNVYAVGDGGTIVRWDGARLHLETSNTTEDLNGIWGTSASNIWAVGDGGTLVRYNGSTWQVTTLPSAANLRGVWGSAADNVYAVGDTGAVYRWDGDDWEPVDGVGSAATKEGFLRNLNAVWGSSATDVYFVGDTGVIIHGNGSTWEQQPYETGFPIHRDLHGIWGAGPADVWAVAKHTVILHNNLLIDTVPDYPGPPDTLFYTGPWDHLNVDGLADILAIHGTGVGNVYAVNDSGDVLLQNQELIGDGGDGAGFWSRMTSVAPQNAFLRGVWAASETEIFIVGDNGLFVRGVR